MWIERAQRPQLWEEFFPWALPLSQHTCGLDNSFLEHALFMLFDDLRATADGTIVAACQGVIDAQAQLPQEGIEHFQHCRSWERDRIPEDAPVLRPGFLFSKNTT